MQSLDWIVVWAYLAGMLCLALYLSRKQTSSEDYFLGSHNLSAKTLAASTIATQCSTNSLLGAPAFVGFVAGGGMIWLQYVLAVPLAMFALLWLRPQRRRSVLSDQSLPLLQALPIPPRPPLLPLLTAGDGVGVKSKS